jgi:chemotaxis protein MotB
MKADRLLLAWLVGGCLSASSGCLFVPKTQLNQCQAQNRALSEQNRAQLTETENLKVHSRNIENQLQRTEQELALVSERAGLQGDQLANYQRECTTLDEQLQGLAGGRGRISAEVGRQLVALSRRYGSLHFDPAAAIGKLDTDVLFESGQAELKPEAQEMLRHLARVLKSPEASELKVMVVGHTDDRLMAKKAAREQFPNNFHLSATRALAVADLLREAGLPDERLAVAGMGAHQPIAPNSSPPERQKNRRVEIFVMAADTPVVGWTDSIPGVY